MLISLAVLVGLFLHQTHTWCSSGQVRTRYHLPRTATSNKSLDSGASELLVGLNLPEELLCLESLTHDHLRLLRLAGPTSHTIRGNTKTIMFLTAYEIPHHIPKPSRPDNEHNYEETYQESEVDTRLTQRHSPTSFPRLSTSNVIRIFK